MRARSNSQLRVFNESTAALLDHGNCHNVAENGKMGHKTEWPVLHIWLCPVNYLY